MARMPELDALRGLAAMVIMLLHLRFMGRHARWGGGMDIDVFFVLSGYLITTSILNGSKAANFFRVFYTRRVVRIWPLYFLVMLACVAINPILPRRDPLAGLPFYLTFTQNVHGYWRAETPFFSRFFQHTWTLAIEEQYYLIWPLLVHRLGRRGVYALTLPFLVVPMALRALDLNGHMLLTRCDSLALGSLLAALLDDKERLARRLPAFRGTFAAIVAVGFSVPLWRDAALTPLRAANPSLPWDRLIWAVESLRVGMADFGLIGLVIVLSGTRWVAPLRNRGLCYLGRISYGLYMWHPIIFGVVTLVHLKLGYRPSAAMDAIKAGACIGAAALSWELLESRLLAIRRPAAGRGPALRGPHARPAAAPVDARPTR